MRKTFLLAAAAAVAPLTLAVAQPPAAPTAGAPEHPRFDRAAFAQKMAEHRAQRAADLATVLGLKPAQKPALDQWLAAMAPPMGEHKGPPPAEGAPPPTTADRLAREQAHIAERQQRDTARLDATKRFYASLDPQQQKVFDALDRLRHDHGGPEHGFGGHRGPGGPGGDMPPPQQGE